MSLPSLTNSMVGTRLLDLISTTATSNEVITLGYSNDYGTQIRLYDNNLPSSGGIIKYNSSNFAISFIRDYNNTVNVGINTSRPNATLHIVGDVNITGTFNTSNLIVTGSSTYNATSIGVVNTLSIYQPSGTDIYGTAYKNITTNDTTANNRILFTTSLQSGKYLFSFNIPYSNLTPSFLLNTTYVNLGLYNSPFTLSSQPLQSFSIPVYKNTNQLNVTPEFYLPVSSTTSYDIAIGGQGEKLQFGGSNTNCTANIITISGLSNLSSTTYTSSLPQISPLRQTYKINVNNYWPTTPIDEIVPSGSNNGIVYIFQSTNQYQDWRGRWFYDYDYSSSLTMDGYGAAGQTPAAPVTGGITGCYSGISSSTAFILSGYRFESPVTSKNRMPAQIYVMASTNGSTWTPINIYTATSADYTSPIINVAGIDYYGLDRRFNNTTSYNYYRVVFRTLLTNTSFQILEFRWYLGEYSSTMTTSQLTLTANGYYPTTHGSNIKIYKNGSNLNYISPTQNDFTYTYSYSNINNVLNTKYTINFNSQLITNDVVDVSIWPSITDTIYLQNGYMYQNIMENSLTNSSNLYLESSTQYVGIGTTTPSQQLTVNGQSYFNSNVGIGTISPSAFLTVNDTWNDGSTTMVIQQPVINQEFPPVGISNFYFTPDYNDTIPSTEIGAQFSNLEYPPYAMTNYSTNLNAIYGAGYYTASASSEQGGAYVSWRAFDKNIATAGPSFLWLSATSRYNASSPYAYNGTNNTYDINGVNYPGEWLQIQLPIPIKVEKYSINVRSDVTTTNPSQWNVLDSSDGINWNLLDTRNGITWTTGATNQYGITNPTRFSSYYRLITSNLQGNGGYVSIGEWRLFTNTVIGQNYYPKYKATIPYYTSVNTYGLGEYQIWSDSILNSSYSNQAVPSGLFDKTVGTTSNTFWTAYGGFNNQGDYDPPNIYIKFPYQLLLSSYSLSATGYADQTPSKWTLYGSNTNQTMAWQSLNSQTGITTWTAFETKNYTVTTSSAYNFYKLELLRNSSSVITKMSLGELRFYGSKQTPEPRMVVSTNGFIGIGTNTSSLTTINGDINVRGVLGSSILNNGPNVSFDGSTTNRNTFLQWMQYVTSTDYRYALQPRIIQSCWWNTNTTTITNYSDYIYNFSDDPNIGNTDNMYSGGVLLPDGRIVYIPNLSSNIGIFNSSTNVLSTIQINDTSVSSFMGGVLLPDGRVIFIPQSASIIGIFNSSTNTYSTLLMGYATGIDNWGGVLLPNGNVFFVPYNSTRIQIFNPLTNIFTSILGAPGNNAYRGGVLLPDGRVICIPYDSTRIGIYDSINNIFSTTITGAPGSASYQGGVLLPDGRVVFIPKGNNYFGIFNSITDKYSTILITDLNADGVYNGGVLLPDGRILLVPNNETLTILNLNNLKAYNRNTSTSITFSGGVLLPDGRIVLVPKSYTKSYTNRIPLTNFLSPVNPPRPPPLELCYHPCFNHV